MIAFDLFDPFFSSSLPLSVTSNFLSLAVKVNYLEHSTQLQRPYLKLIFSAVTLCNSVDDRLLSFPGFINYHASIKKQEYEFSSTK